MLQPSNAALTFLLALFAGWVNRQQQRVVEYLAEEDPIPKTGYPASQADLDEVQLRDRLGGVLRYYHRAASSRRSLAGLR